MSTFEIEDTKQEALIEAQYIKKFLEEACLLLQPYKSKSQAIHDFLLKIAETFKNPTSLKLVDMVGEVKQGRLEPVLPPDECHIEDVKVDVSQELSYSNSIPANVPTHCKRCQHGLVMVNLFILTRRSLSDSIL